MQEAICSRQEILFSHDDLAALVDMQVKALWGRMQRGDIVPYIWRRRSRWCIPSICRLPGVTAVGGSDRQHILSCLEGCSNGERVGYRFLGEEDVWERRGDVWALCPPSVRPSRGSLVGLLVEEAA